MLIDSTRRVSTRHSSPKCDGTRVARKRANLPAALESIEQQTRCGRANAQCSILGDDVELENQIKRRGFSSHLTLQHCESDRLIIPLDRENLSIRFTQQRRGARDDRREIVGSRAHLRKPKHLSVREPVAPASGMTDVTKHDRHASVTQYKKTRAMASHHPGFVWELNAPDQ